MNPWGNKVEVIRDHNDDPIIRRPIHHALNPLPVPDLRIGDSQTRIVPVGPTTVVVPKPERVARPSNCVKRGYQGIGES